MAELSWAFGILGGLCLVMGIVTIMAVVPEFMGLTWVFWLMVSTIMLLTSIAFALGYWNSGEKG